MFSCGSVSFWLEVDVLLSSIHVDVDAIEVVLEVAVTVETTGLGWSGNPKLYLMKMKSDVRNKAMLTWTTLPAEADIGNG